MELELWVPDRSKNSVDLVVDHNGNLYDEGPVTDINGGYFKITKSGKYTSNFWRITINLSVKRFTL